MFRRSMIVLLCLSNPCAALAAEPGLKDPMRPYSPPPAAQPAATGGWRLTTIVRSADHHVAVINGKALRVGDQIGGAQVEAIEAWQVRLKRGAENIVVPLRRLKIRNAIIQREAKP